MRNRLRKILVRNACLLIAIEAVFRVVSGLPLLEFPNFRQYHMVSKLLPMPLEYDPMLGWRPVSEPAMRTDGVLAVGGDSTIKPSADASERWPSVLESITGTPVTNAATPGYAADQIILRAEKLLPVVRPRTLVVALTAGDIIGAGYRVSEWPKPYFDVVAGKLQHHDARLRSEDDPAQGIKNALGRVAFVDWLMRSLNPGWWYRANFIKQVRGTNDETDVTCRLLFRLKRVAAAANARVVVMLLSDGERPPIDHNNAAAIVRSCAHESGLQVLDMIEQPAAATLEPAGTHTRRVADLVARALTDAPSGSGCESSGAEAFVPGDGQNLVAKSESLDEVNEIIGAAAIATLKRTHPNVGRWQTFRMAAAGAAGEHYLTISNPTLPAGCYTLALDVKADGAGYVVVQLLDRQVNGLMAEFDLEHGTATHSRTNLARELRTAVDDMGRGWRRISVSARLPTGSPTFLIQLSDQRRARNFIPNGEAILIRAVQFERGQSSSTYRPTSAPHANAQAPR
jgi:hypothetical protein